MLQVGMVCSMNAIDMLEILCMLNFTDHLPIHAKPSLSIYGMGKCTTNEKNLGCERLVILHVHVLKTVDNEAKQKKNH